MSKHTPLPWHWGIDVMDPKAWPTELPMDSMKYADLGLYGPNNQEILPLRTDHYDVIWNAVDPLNPADAQLIVHSVNNYPKVVAALRTLLDDEIYADGEGLTQVADADSAKAAQALLNKIETQNS